MASISKSSNGHRTIQFIDNDSNRTRRTIRLGKCTDRQALAYKIKIEALIAAKIHNAAADDEVSRWLVACDETMHGRIAAAGLCQPRGSLSVRGFIDDFLARRTDLKPRTIINLQQTRRHLLAFIDGSRSMRNITPADAEDFRLHLRRAKPKPEVLEQLSGAGLGDNTARRLLGRCRQLFTAAIRRGVASSNPFADIECKVQANPERFYFLSRADAARINDACPDATWRLIFALARYGGLRTPSETLALTWSDID